MSRYSAFGEFASKSVNIAGESVAQKFALDTDMRIVAGTAGTPEEPSKKNTLEIRFPFASK